MNRRVRSHYVHTRAVVSDYWQRYKYKFDGE